jgi:hypothetical protein
MSMPREDAYSQLPAGPDRPRTGSPPGRGSARFIGRVGTLAVALGLGAAVASSPGIALADTDGSGSTGTASTSDTSHDPASGKDAPSGAVSAGAPGNGTHSSPGVTRATRADARDADAKDADADNAGTDVEEGPTAADRKSPGTTGTAETTASTEPGSVDHVAPDPKPAKPNGHPAVAAKASAKVAAEASAVQPTATPLVDGAEPSLVRSSRNARIATVAPDVPESQATQSDPQPAAMLATLDAVPARQSAPAPAPAPVAGPVGLVTGLVSGFLSAVGLNPHAVNGPAAPPQPPMSWAMLGWVRRELGNVLAPATQAASSTIAATSLVATSPLGTQQQLAAEQVATRTVDTLPVQLMKLVLRFGFLSAAQKNFDLVGGPDAANIAALNDAVDEYAMGAAFQQQLLNSMDPTVVMQVAPPHS